MSRWNQTLHTEGSKAGHNLLALVRVASEIRGPDTLKLIMLALPWQTRVLVRFLQY